MRSPLLTHFRWWPRRPCHLLHQNVVCTRASSLAAATHLDLDWPQEYYKDLEAESPITSVNSTATTTDDSKPDIAQGRHRKTSNKSTNDLFSRIYKVKPQGSRSKQWLHFLEQQRLRHGHEGVEAVWQCMQAQKLQLRPHDQAISKVWNILLSAFLDRPELLEGLIRHAGQIHRTSGDDFHFLYTPIMLYMLKYRPELSSGFFVLLHEQSLVPRTRAAPCISAVVESQEQAAAFDTFRYIYETGSERNLYDPCLLGLKSSHASYTTMCKWHSFLLSHGDAPSATFRSNPLVEILFSRVRVPNYDPSANNASENSAEDVLEYLPLTRERLSTVVGEIHGIKQKSVTDAFCARVFATGGLSTGFLIAGLSMLGLDTIGPLAVRELAARSRTIPAFQDALKIVRERNVAITPCTFSKALEKFAEEDRQDLFDSIVNSDRHPDIYEDRELLESLVDDCLKVDRSLDAHAILAVLSMSAKHHDEHRWNTLIQAEARIHRADKVATILKDMIGQKLEITGETIHSIRTHLLPYRERGKRPQITGKRKQAEDDLLFVTNLFLSVASTGKRIHVSHWRELIKRYGMECRMNGLRYLVLEVVRHYLPSQSPAGRPSNESQNRSTRCLRAIRVDSPLRQLLNTTMQCAMIAWGFNSEAAEKYLPAALRGPQLEGDLSHGEKWLRGLTLLIQIRDEGVPIDIQSVRNQVMVQLGHIFMPRFALIDGQRMIITHDDAELLRRFDVIEKTWSPKGLFRFGNDRNQMTEADRLQWVLSCLFDRTGWIAKRQKKLKQSNGLG
ncbi:hypothetical protein K461DRAFT_80917 [Myriangium duriaei CBS 260.36]|uniref:Pentatricopeptide repeat domain-containing protein n=1 Tax=Myriangium duriaei CBS 260.36 TaxID=1168546 RepID=A0A9P4JBF4_9PEZI|nr:hypothetical protein K461DRAFT_80917 [Myriangium duriaei CBS 260.36]